MKIDKPSFFDWVKYKSSIAPELKEGGGTTYPVVIVGAGPVGLTLALTLAQQSISVLLLELKDQLSDSSRTLAVARRSLQVLDRLGLSKEFCEKAITREMNYVYHGKELVYSSPYEQSISEKFPDISVLQQPWTEKILLDCVLSNLNIDLRWQHTVTGVVPQDNGNTIINIASPEGSYSVEANYVIAADGARGSIRRSLGLQYEEIGDGVLQRNFVICDFELPSDL